MQKDKKSSFFNYAQQNKLTCQQICRESKDKPIKIRKVKISYLQIL